MTIHFIAIGGSVMHQLAIALKEQGHHVSGSDDMIFNPAQSNLEAAGLLPSEMGWFPERVTAQTDSIILGMHAKADNPELLKAKELGVKIYSFPTFIAEHAKNKQRIVVGGSHGKTTVTSIIINALQHAGKKFDYLIGGRPEGFDKNIRLSADAPIMIIEGDEYLTSPLDSTPKFLHYDGHIRIITGIAWDHINVFPNFEEYVEQFRKFINTSPKSGTLIYNSTDKLLSKTLKKSDIRDDVNQVGYEPHKHKITDGNTVLIDSDKNKHAIKLFGEHNMMNINAAFNVCTKIGVSPQQFYDSLKDFKGADMRLQLVANKNSYKTFRDFAHAPSKVEATVNAVKAQFGKEKLIACVELHTFSSLSKDFLPQYKDTLNKADKALVYFNPEILANKKLPNIYKDDVGIAFNHKNISVFTDAEQLRKAIAEERGNGGNLLLMSSGNFGGLKIEGL